MPRVRCRRVFEIALVAALAACGGDADPYGRTLGPEPAACAGPWKRVWAPDQAPLQIPGELRWHAGRLYYSQSGNDEMIIVSDDGRIATTRTGLPNLWMPQLWFEGDRLAYVREVGRTELDLTYELLTADLTGGPPTSATRFTLTGGSSGLYARFDLTKDAVFAMSGIGPKWLAISRFDRTTGAEQVVATVEDKNDAHLTGALVVWRDWLFVSSFDSFAVPLVGGAVVPAQAGRSYLSAPIGVSSSGQILWGGSSILADERSEPILAVAQIGTGEPPRELDAELPRGSVMTRAWDDGNGGWYMVGREHLGDGAVHSSVWSLDARGKATRIACDPEAGRQLSHGAVSPAGLYLVASAIKLDYDSEITFVPRPHVLTPSR